MKFEMVCVCVRVAFVVVFIKEKIKLVVLF